MLLCSGSWLSQLDFGLLRLKKRKCGIFPLTPSQAVKVCDVLSDFPSLQESLKKNVLLKSIPASPLHEELLKMLVEKKQIKLKAHLQLRRTKAWHFKE